MTNILVVDDEKSIRTTLSRFLLDADYSVQTAENSMQAIDLIEQQEFDIVLLDIILPKISGVKLLGSLTEDHPGSIVIMMTGEPTLETATESLRLGAFDFLVKPITKSRVLQAVGNAVRVITLNNEKKVLEQENRHYQQNLEQLVARKSEALRESHEQLLLSHEQLKRHQQQLILAEKLASLGQVASGIAHELYNPVAFIFSNLGTLKVYMQMLHSMVGVSRELAAAALGGDQPRISELQKQLDKLEAGGNLEFVLRDVEQLVAESEAGIIKVRDIVNNLRTYSHAPSETRAVMDINEMVESSLSMVLNEIRYKCEIDRELNALTPVECYPERLNLVFVNLLVNAVQAITENGRIGIATSQSGEHTTVRISDSGSGIDPEHMGKLFDPFFTTKTTGAGTGLGLSLCQSIVAKHGGKIDVHSEPDKGSTFSVVLPNRLP